MKNLRFVIDQDLDDSIVLAQFLYNTSQSEKKPLKKYEFIKMLIKNETEKIIENNELHTKES